MAIRRLRRAAWLVAATCLIGAPAGAAMPGMVRTQGVVATAASGPERADGSLRVRLFAMGEAVPTAAATGALRIRVRDVAAFDADVTITGCRIGARSLSCVSADGRVRARVKPRSLEGRVGWDVKLAAKRLAATRTGTQPPKAPLRVSLVGAWRDAPLNVVRACRTSARVVRCGATRPPNVLVVLTDDQRWDALDVMPQVQARLVAQGTSFTNAFVTTPVCCPSRASILSGLYAHNHGTRTLGPPDGGAPAFVGPDASTVATWLHDAGYRTALFGKYMNSYAELGPPKRATWYVPPGWTAWGAFVTPEYLDYELVRETGLVEHHGVAEADYSTDVTAARALAFIDDALSDDTPFFLFWVPYAPHVNRNLVAATPAPRHAGLFADVAPWRPPSFSEADVADKPAWVQAMPPIEGLLAAFVDANRRIGFESLQAVDEGVAALLARIDAAGAADDTVVLFSSDNGFAHGEHRLRAKLCPYDECIRVPLVVRAPGIAAAGATDDRLVENVDLAATLAAVAGLAPPDAIDGRSLLPPLMGEAGPWRSDVLIEQWRVFGSAEYFAVRTETWKYVEDRDTGEVELYDLVADPFELENRAADPALAAQRAALRELALARAAAAPGAAIP